MTDLDTALLARLEEFRALTKRISTARRYLWVKLNVFIPEDRKGMMRRNNRRNSSVNFRELKYPKRTIRPSRRGRYVI